MKKLGNKKVWEMVIVQVLEIAHQKEQDKGKTEIGDRCQI